MSYRLAAWRHMEKVKMAEYQTSKKNQKAQTKISPLSERTYTAAFTQWLGLTSSAVFFITLFPSERRLELQG